jgi:predicted RNase H-like nuclease (RuvC/YqgF family)
MSDANMFMNTYVDHAIGMIHENINVVLQLKTQLKMANELLSEKDAAIGSLMSQLDSDRNINAEMTDLRDKARYWEESYHSMVNKTSHMDTALSQIAQMKAEIKDRDAKIAKLEEKLNPTKKTINTKKKPIAIAGDAKDEVSNVPVAIAGNATDDF